MTFLGENLCREITDDEARMFASQLEHGRAKFTFGRKENRDKVFRNVRNIYRRDVFRRTAKNQLLDDHYVTDIKDATDRGLGNIKHSWSTLYLLEN